MKTTGLFNNCIVTKKGTFFCGETMSGDLIYANNRDVERGFKLFTNYKLQVDESTTEMISVYGNHFCASISRIPSILQIPDWMRIKKLITLMSEGDSVSQPAIARLENISDMSRLESVVNKFPTLHAV